MSKYAQKQFMANQGTSDFKFWKGGAAKNKKNQKESASEGLGFRDGVEGGKGDGGWGFVG